MAIIQRLLWASVTRCEKRAFRCASNEVAPVSKPTRIYNTPAHEEVVKNWKPQVPGGPVHDGWAMARWPFRGTSPFFYFGLLAFGVSAFWLPWFALEYHTKKANQAK